MFDVIGGEILERSLGGPAPADASSPSPRRRHGSPRTGRAVFFVVEPDRTQLADLARRLRDGRLRPIVGAVRPLAEAAAAFGPGQRVAGKTIIRVVGDDGSNHI